jgi:rSAM/selenodomain-associated transferase 2
MLSVVVPTLNAAGSLAATLAALEDVPGEIVVCDGGSNDGTADLAAAIGARVVVAPRGRGGQLAAGIAVARGDWLLLLHADTRLAPGWVSAVRRHMEAEPGRAGYFRFVLASADPRARRLERLVEWRCRRLALPYGDQGLLLSRDLLDAVGGMRPLPLMEDVDLVRRLGRRRLVPLAADAITSAARWERNGWIVRSARNLLCLALYLVGVPPRLIRHVYT